MNVNANGIDPQVAERFRQAMRRVAASVTLVTSLDKENRPHGMAASAVIPVSMDPAAMLVAANSGSSLSPVIRQSGCFCINVLGEGHLDLLLPFSQSSRRHERFLSDEWREGARSLPYFPSAPVSVFCELDQSVDYGTHTLFIGRVIEVRLFEEEVDPLIWFNGAGASLSRSRAMD